MGKVELLEEIATGEPSKTLVLKGPHWTFRMGMTKLGPLKKELELLRDKLVPLDNKMAPLIAKGLTFQPPRMNDKTFIMQDAFLLTADVAVAIRDHLYKKMDFDPTPKQTTLAGSKKPKKGKKG